MIIFEPYQDNKGEHRWRILSTNGNIIAEGGESYKRRSAMLRSVRRMFDNIAHPEKIRARDNGHIVDWATLK